MVCKNQNQNQWFLRNCENHPTLIATTQWFYNLAAYCITFSLQVLETVLTSTQIPIVWRNTNKAEETMGCFGKWNTHSCRHSVFWHAPHHHFTLLPSLSSRYHGNFWKTKMSHMPFPTSSHSLEYCLLHLQGPSKE
jgi:hypothetical protein